MRCSAIFRVVLLLAITCGAKFLQAKTVVAPYSTPSGAVGCSDVEMDYSKLLPGFTAGQAWRGEGTYVDKLFVRPTSTAAGPLVFPANIPKNSSIFKRYSNLGVRAAETFDWR